MELSPAYYDKLRIAAEVECWNSDEMTVADHLSWLEFYNDTNDQILDVLEERGEWFGHFYYDSYSQFYDYHESGQADIDLQNSDVVDITWQEEYEFFCDVVYSECLCEDDFWTSPFGVYCLREADILAEGRLNIEQELLKHKRWDKKRKHLKDGKAHSRYLKDKWVEELAEEWWLGELPILHKHLRSQKVYLEEEYNDTDSAFWFDHYGEFGYHKYDEIDSELEMYLLGYQHCSCELCLEGLNDKLLKRGLHLADFNLE